MTSSVVSVSDDGAQVVHIRLVSKERKPGKGMHGKSRATSISGRDYGIRTATIDGDVCSMTYYASNLTKSNEKCKP